MDPKKILVVSANAFGYLYLLYVIGYVEQERKKLAKEVSANKVLRIKHRALVRTFENAFNRLSEEDQQKVMEAANVEMVFAKIIRNID